MKATCPHCHGHVAPDPALAGVVVVCPHCGGQFQMPGHDSVSIGQQSPTVAGRMVERRTRGKKRDNRLLWAGVGAVVTYVVLHVALRILLRS